MSCIVYQTDKKTGAKYAYESVSYWDKEKQQPRSKRKYLGRVDPDTGEIIAKKSRSHSGDNSARADASQISKLEKELLEKDKEIEALKAGIAEISQKYHRLARSLGKIRHILDSEQIDPDDEEAAEV